MPFPTSEMIETNGIRLEVFRKGPADPSAPAIVLCHGWPEHAFSWRHQIDPLVDAGYQVIVPNQRGYGRSSRPEKVEDYDIDHLTGDLTGVLDHFGYDDAIFIGHDWGAIVVWNLAMMHPKRVRGVINLSVPFMERGEREWVGFWESQLGPDFYIVHFNRQPGVADAVFDANPKRFLRNMYQTNQWKFDKPELPPGMAFIGFAELDSIPGDSFMSDTELDVFVDAFKESGFTGGLNWYRNFSRNWEIIGAYEQYIHQPTLLIYGEYDMVPKKPNLSDFVGDLTTTTLPCGHWIQQELPAETNAAILKWLEEKKP